MTDNKLGSLFHAFANFYWSVPVAFVVDRIEQWHPELTKQQLERVMDRLSGNTFWKHCRIVSEGLNEPVLVVEHLLAVDDKDFDRFVAARIDCPFAECDEETLLNYDSIVQDMPEARAVYAFGQTELGLDDEWTRQLVHDCVISQPYALCDGESWVMAVLQMESYGKIRFRTIDRVKRFRELGNQFYAIRPNPVLRGWRPVDVENAPNLLDDIPENDGDIPDGRPEMDAIFAQYGAREKIGELFMKSLEKTNPSIKKIGRNDPCPCGSGLKYKKCTCAQYHEAL